MEPSRSPNRSVIPFPDLIDVSGSDWVAEGALSPQRPPNKPGKA